MPAKRPVMICTRAPGGMRSVVQGYYACGLGRDFDFLTIWSHVPGGSLRKIVQLFYSVAKLATLLTLKKVSFAHIHVSMRASFWRKSLLAWMCEMVRVPVVFHLHGSQTKEFYDSLTDRQRLLFKSILESKSRVIVLSQHWDDFVRGIAPRANISIVPNFSPPPAAELLVDYRVRSNQVLFLGEVGLRKGAFDLIAAWKMLVDRGLVDWKLVIAGNGDIEKAQSTAIQLGVADSIVFTGWVDPLRKRTLLSESKIFTLPSYNEGVPMSLIEAMGWGLPAVVTPVGGIAEVTRHKETAVLISPGRVDEIATALSSLMFDSEAAEKMGSAARSYAVDNFSGKISVDTLRNIYLGLSHV